MLMMHAAARPSHLRHGVFAHQEGAGEIDADRPVPLLQRKRLDRPVGGHGRGDIDERGEPAERRDRTGDNGAGARFIGDVNLQRADAAAALGDGAGGRFRLGRHDIRDRDLGAFRREPSRDGAADLAAAAGDERDALRQPAGLPHG